MHVYYNNRNLRASYIPLVNCISKQCFDNLHAYFEIPPVLIVIYLHPRNIPFPPLHPRQIIIDIPDLIPGRRFKTNNDTNYIKRRIRVKSPLRDTIHIKNNTTYY